MAPQTSHSIEFPIINRPANMTRSVLAASEDPIALEGRSAFPPAIGAVTSGAQTPCEGQTPSQG